MKKIALVAICKLNYINDILYSYTVSEDLQNFLEIGKRVVVPFGRGNLKRQGVVIDIYFSDKSDNLKNICDIIDDFPVLSSEMLMIVKWLKSHTFCTYYEAIDLVIPKVIGGKIKKISYSFEDKNLEKLSYNEKIFVDNLKKLGLETFTLNDIKNLNIKCYSKILDSLLLKKVLKENIHISKKVKEKITNIFKVNPDFLYSIDNVTEKQLKILDFFKKYPFSSSKEIIDRCGVSRYIINSMLKKNMIVRAEKSNDFENNYKDTVLNCNQDKIFNNILDIYKKNIYNVSLFYGVTGSGKTHVVLKLIDEVIKSGKSSIFLVPEIALTSQFIEIFASRYQDKVAIIHSKISAGEKAKTWEKISNGEISVVIGARSAVFAPFKNLGLIVIDEEHEFTYKSENSPRFDAREVAKIRCNFNNCMLLLCSATPSVESYNMAKMGKYNLFELKERYGKSILPSVQIVDMNGKYNREGQVLYSQELLNALRENIEKKNQSIIFLNRRGFNTFVKCLSCGEVQMCPNCSVSLNYHKFDDKLVCHYCGYFKKDIDKCMFCGEKKLAYLGFGTQRAQEQLEKFFPNAKILRLDSDTKFSISKNTVKDFEKGKYDILIGTQMISKGFNFPKVTLVGILMADQYLYSGDFRAYEKAFSIITQTIGRAGRSDLKGKAIIQTYCPENEILKLASNQDYEKFFSNEIKLRKLMLMPPFVDICLISLRGKNKENVYEFSKIFFSTFVKISKDKYSDIPMRAFAPSTAALEKIDNIYRYKIVIKCKNSKNFRNLLNEVIFKCKSIGKYRNNYIIVDINPISIL